MHICTTCIAPAKLQEQLQMQFPLALITKENPQIVLFVHNFSKRNLAFVVVGGVGGVVGVVVVLTVVIWGVVLHKIRVHLLTVNIIFWDSTPVCFLRKSYRSASSGTCHACCIKYCDINAYSGILGPTLVI